MTGRGGADDRLPPAPLNRMLRSVFALERHLVGRVSLPAGLTPAYEDNPGKVILQHGGGRALQMAVDTEAFVTLNRRKTRVYYRTTTEGGSSGSPCFDMDMNFVALHQAFVSRLGKDDKANTGVPVDAIYRLLDKRGKLGDVIGKS